MTKQFALKNTANGKYWTGEYWNRPYSSNAEDAKLFQNESDIKSELLFQGGGALNELYEAYGMSFELVTIYSL